MKKTLKIIVQAEQDQDQESKSNFQNPTTNEKYFLGEGEIYIQQ